MLVQSTSKVNYDRTKCFKSVMRIKTFIIKNICQYFSSVKNYDRSLKNLAKSSKYYYKKLQLARIIKFLVSSRVPRNT